MIKFFIFISIGILITFNSFTQTITRVSGNNSYYSYSSIKYDWGPYYFNQTMGLVRGFLYEQRMKELKEENRKLMAKKTKEYTDYYDDFDKYPETVKDGWHNVVLLNGDRFMDERKVYVESNKIKQVVFDNWMPEEMSFTGPIKKGKSAMSFKNASQNLNGLIEVYFFDAIADPSGDVSKPLDPGKLVCWTTSGSYIRMNANIDGNNFGPFVVKHKKKDLIDPNNAEELIIYVKPGTIVYGRGSTYSKKLMGKAGRVIVAEGETKIVRIQ